MPEDNEGIHIREPLEKQNKKTRKNIRVAKQFWARKVAFGLSNSNSSRGFFVCFCTNTLAQDSNPSLSYKLIGQSGLW